MIIECQVLCTKKERGPISEMDAEQDVWLPIAIDLSKIVAIKVSGDADGHDQFTQLYTGDGTSDYFIVDIPYQEVLTKFKSSRTNTPL